jgi:hypothetical protein
MSIQESNLIAVERAIIELDFQKHSEINRPQSLQIDSYPDKTN